jgi:ParB-like nuclease family protein
MGRRGRPPLLSLGEATRRLHPSARHHVGVRAIPVRQIIGSEGREADFDRRFVPRRRESAARQRALEQAFPGGDFPPIVVDKIGDAYFVVDGHHRISIARRLGMETIDADVTALSTRWRLDADADLDELIHAEQEWLFMRASGLELARPEARIRFTLPIGYAELLEAVQTHGYSLVQEEGAVRSGPEVAAHWYDRVYLATTASISRGRIEGFCRNATDADRFLNVRRVLRELRLQRPHATLDDAVRRLAPLPA